ncbi:MAG: AMP-binding protein [Actinomycetota bacterium]
MNTTRVALVDAGARILLSDLAGRTRNGNELTESVDRLAGALFSRGLAGARIGLWHTNSIAAIEASLAVEWLGGTRVPVDPDAAPAEARAIWQAADVDAVLVDMEHEAGAGGDVLVHDDARPLAGSALLPVADVDPHRTVLLYPRAVQSGELFAVPISYGNWEATLSANISLYRRGAYGPGFGPDECFLTVQQIMHGTGLVGTFPFLRMGLPQIIVGRFNADVVLDLLRDGAITSAMMVTGMVTRLAAAAAARPGGMGGLRRLLYGGAPMSEPELRESVRHLGDVLVQIYGRLEGGWPLTVLDQGDHRRIVDGDADAAGSCGRPVPEAGQLMLRPTAEVCVRSSMVVREYADADGWCSLGDLGRLKGDYLHLIGRLDRMINTGYHVYPAEIEEAIREHAGVLDAHVRGESDEQHGQVVVAYVRPASGTDPDVLVSEMRTALGTRLAKYKLPRRYHIVDVLPEA